MRDVLDVLGIGPATITTLKDLPKENASWLVETTDGERLVLRRYHDRATLDDLAYEHDVLRHLDALGWVVPVPLSDLVDHDGRWYCLNRWVPGEAVRGESVEQRRRRGRDLARLQFALRDLDTRLGQRTGWEIQHLSVSGHTDVDMARGAEGLARVDKGLAQWAIAAAEEIVRCLEAGGARELPVTVVHGDFAEWNVHYDVEGRLAGVIDFGLTHLDSRPYELAIARTYRSPETVAAYADELLCLGWPLSELEVACIQPVYRAFRVNMVAWQLEVGRRTGTYDIPMIERQLALTGTERP